MKSEKFPLDQFGQLISERLRDSALGRFDKLCQGQQKAPGLQHLQSSVAGLSGASRAIARRCLVSAIDGAIHDFLFTLHEGTYNDAAIAFLLAGQDVNQLGDGLHGEPFGTGGWFARFSAFGAPPEEA